ncbi:MAG TPA: TetM/TetW/TetO/TetS family tetracycline resistance ribosomal protection protein [Candidatus Mediterraneibacter cottocaccae]|nr:TetM/TetW/TetO/TetS family tetracycline resistance ribosomal protection protein [Candidatus Mediterraneibacter cottocaccae]
MGNTLKHITLGLVAHVDAGKTTLSEGMLYLAGITRKLGRVDHGDAFLDTYELERERGITIFSKQAVFPWNDAEITILDTPGHVDFSAEMERTLQVLDYVVLVISALDGVQGHTETLWRLLKRYEIPTFIFVNKMDQEGADRERILAQLRARFGDGCIDFGGLSGNADMLEDLAVCDEVMMEEFLEHGTIGRETIRRVIRERHVFPCYFGCALRAEGIEELLDGITEYAFCPQYPETFGARVYKIARDDQGSRLTYMKITGGSLRVKETVPGIQEKVNQIRIYSGAKYEMVQEALPGQICAVTGLDSTRPGQGLGEEEEAEMPVLEPVLTYRIELPDECDPHTMLRSLRQLEEEEPELHIVWEEKLGEIHAKLMGEVQIEVLRRQIKERFGVSVTFGEGSIVYKETIGTVVEGVGHFEPLRHYAEVHLKMEPGERGSGLQFASECSEDILDRNWQRLILTHLEEKEHRGVLTGAAVTDMKITLISGRAHQKHTEGGDFRQATYRAVRQGLMKAESILLEPYYAFRMELPAGNVGRAMTDIRRMSGTFDTPETDGDSAVLTGSVPVETMRGYQTEFAAYTGGRGRLSCVLKGYDVCHNADEVIAAADYDPEADLENPAGSVFCAHGAGFVVPWYEVEDYMHLEGMQEERGTDENDDSGENIHPGGISGGPGGYRRIAGQERRQIELTREELDAIYVRTPDPVKRKVSSTPVTVRAKNRNESAEAEGSAQNDKWAQRRRDRGAGEEYLLVDGYNIIFSWEELKDLADTDIGAARGKLMDLLCNYQGYRKCTLILVFDAYKVEGNPGEVMKYHNIYVVYTKEAETADQYIEKTVRKIARQAQVTVATSDALEQVIILGQGARRMSAPGLKEEVELAISEMRGEHLGKGETLRNYLFNYLEKDTAKIMESVRLGKEKLD